MHFRSLQQHPERLMLIELMLMMLAMLHVCSLPQRTERLMLMMLALGICNSPERLMMLALAALQFCSLQQRTGDADDVRPGRGGCALVAMARAADADDARRATDADDARRGRQCTFEACSNIQSG